ncbi:MAG: hypothetical protein WBB01_06410 [Phormidesmis sp.]
MGKRFKIERIKDVEKPAVPFIEGFICGIKATAVPAVITMIAIAAFLLIQNSSRQGNAPAPTPLPAQHYPSN